MDSREAKFEETHSNLKAALKSCRAVVRNYRELLADGRAAGHPHPPSNRAETG